MSGHSTEERFVIVADARRRRSRAEKEAIVAELMTSGETVSAIARKHNIAASLLFRWRREFGSPTAAPDDGAGRLFVPVALPAPATMPKAVNEQPCKTAIEIVLAGGRRVIVGPDVDASALRRVIAALEPG